VARRKQNAISANSLSSTRKDKQQYLNVAYKILVEQCKKEEPEEVAVITLCSYINTLRVLISIIDNLLKKETGGAVVVKNTEVALIKSHLDMLIFYKEEISTKFGLSVELH